MSLLVSWQPQEVADYINLTMSRMNYNAEMEYTPMSYFFAWVDAGEFTSSPDKADRKTHTFVYIAYANECQRKEWLLLLRITQLVRTMMNLSVILKC